jgi:hypothetical protein
VYNPFGLWDKLMICCCLAFKQFKEEYNTEKKILAAIKPSEGSPDWVVHESEEIKAGLFDLLHVSFHSKEIACFSFIPGLLSIPESKTC